MKKNLLITISSGILIVVLSSITQFAFTSSGGPPAGKTGSPGDGGVTCNTGGCHTGTPVTPAVGWITSNIPVGGYQAGQTYTITATATLAGCVRFGFQVSPQSLTGTLLGTLIVTDAVNTQIVSTKYMEQKSAGTTGFSNSHPWSFNWTAPVAGTGAVTFYGAFNCSNNNGSSSGDQIFTSTYTINECNLSTTITANGPTTFCPGGSVTLNAGAGFSSYLWSTGATTQTIVASSQAAYTVTVTNSGGCSAVSAPINVIVSTPPTTPGVNISGPTTFCDGGSVTLTAPAGLTSYLWSTGSISQNITVSTAGTYYVTVTNAAGCTAASAPTDVIVNALPTPGIAGSTTICAGGSSILDAGSGYSSYLWSTGATTQTITVSAAATYDVTITNSNGCTGSTSATTTIGNALTPNVSASGATTFCEGDSVMLDVGIGFTSYGWNNGTTNQSITIVSGGNYFVSVTDASGCTGVSVPVDVVVNDTPVYVAVISPLSVCPNDSVAGMATAALTYTYEWNPGSVTGDKVALIPSASTTYTVTATSAQSCSASKTISVLTYTAPSLPAITQSGGTLTAASAGALSYQWFFNGTMITGATNSTYTAGTQPGDYTVEVTGDHGCTVMSDNYNYTGDAIAVLSSALLTVSPNPFADLLTIENLNSVSEVVIMNVQGKIIYNEKISSRNISISTQDFPIGFYLVKIISANEIINRVTVKN